MGQDTGEAGGTSRPGGARVGGVVRSLRWSRRRTLTTAGATLGVLAVGFGPTIWARASAAGQQFSAADVPPAPVVLVLGAGVRPDGNPSPYLRYRLDLAIRLYNAGKARVVLVSGDNRTSHYDEPTAMQRYLVAHGIPARHVVRDFAGRDTYASCVRAVKVFGVRQAIVVTQAYHLPRALAICSAVGLDATGVGDRQAKQHSATWASGSWREYPANIKAAIDVITGRDPILGPPQDSVEQALRA